MKFSKNKTPLSKTYLTSFIVLFAFTFLTACGDGGGSGFEAPIADLTGTWSVTERTLSNNCGDPNTSEQYIARFVQNGNKLDVTRFGQTLKGTISGNKVSWAGLSFPEDGGTTTMTETSITVSDDGGSISGTMSWTWTDGSDGCQGKSSVSGSFQGPLSLSGG